MGRIGGELAALDRALRKLISKGRPLHVVHEAAMVGRYSGPQTEQDDEHKCGEKRIAGHVDGYGQFRDYPVFEAVPWQVVQRHKAIAGFPGVPVGKPECR